MTKEEKAAYWQQRVEDFQASGLSVKHFCAQAGIAVATLHYWRKRFAGVAATPSLATVRAEGFVPVTLAPVRTADAVVDIQLLSGRRLKLAAPVDAVWLQTLVRVLESPCG